MIDDTGSKTPSTTGTGPREAIRWRFAWCTLDESKAELTVAGVITPIEKRLMAILKLMLRHAGEVITKEEMIENVWSRRIVTDTALAKALSRLREVLGDREQTIIKTVHGYGYRLIASVELARGVIPAAIPPALALKAGDSLPQRPHWLLEEHLGSGGRGDLWRVRHTKTNETRVFKFARAEESLNSLKREVTLYRVLAAQLPDTEHLVPLLDWNLSDEPYFTEWREVDGGNLRQWAEKHGGYAAIPLADRLELVAQVAHTLAQAHAIGVLHKDIKPSNVLVEPARGKRPTKALLADFGSGTLVSPESLEQLGITRLGMTQSQANSSANGTPLYLAPEVLAGQPYTMASDIYSLGVMLFQVVIGDDRRLPSPGWERQVPDALLASDIAACVDGDPRLRLSNAAELAQRLRTLPQRHLQADADAAAAAAAEQEHQELGRLRQRRRLWITAAACLLAGLVVSLVLFAEARRARQVAVASDEKAHALNGFLINDLLVAGSARTGEQHDNTIQGLLHEADARVETSLAGQPTARLTIYAALGRSYFNLGMRKDAIRVLQKAVSLEPETPGLLLATRLYVHGQLAQAFMAENAFTQAAPLYCESAQQRQATEGWQASGTVQDQAACIQALLMTGNYAEAIQKLADFEASLAKTNTPAGTPSLDRLDYVQGEVAEVQGQYSTAVMLFTRYWQHIGEHEGKDSYLYAEGALALAHAETLAGQLDAADTHLQFSQARHNALFANAPEMLAWPQLRLGELRLAQGRIAESQVAFTAAIAGWQPLFGEGDWSVLMARNGQLAGYVAQGSVAAQLALAQHNAQVAQQQMPLGNAARIEALLHLAQAQLALHQPAAVQTLETTLREASAMPAQNPLRLQVEKLGRTVSVR